MAHPPLKSQQKLHSEQNFSLDSTPSWDDMSFLTLSMTQTNPTLSNTIFSRLCPITQLKLTRKISSKHPVENN